jgi:hypothetical protein
MIYNRTYNKLLFFQTESQGPCGKFQNFSEPPLQIYFHFFLLVFLNFYFRLNIHIMSKREVSSEQQAAIERRERQRQVALETIDLSKDPYFMRNHLGK